MGKPIVIVGAGLAGSEAALQLVQRGFEVCLYEMRPEHQTPVHKTGDCAELVCSNSLKSKNPESAAGMLKHELKELGSELYRIALAHAVDAGGALAVDRKAFACAVTRRLEDNPHITLKRAKVDTLEELARTSSALMLATGPLTEGALAQSLQHFAGDYLAFFDAAAPIVMADSLDHSLLFKQDRYDVDAPGDYLNAPFTKSEYEHFINELLGAKRVIVRDFETKELFQACQPIEEIAHKGFDAPRYGALKPVGLRDPHTDKRPWAVVQLRAEDRHATSYNLVGFQTNLTFSEQERVFRLIPGLERAEFARFGVMHRNTFVNAPAVLDKQLRVQTKTAQDLPVPLYIIGQLSGTEGYCEAIRSGLHGALSVAAQLKGHSPVELPATTAFGALLSYACHPDTHNYQPMHVNFGIMPPLQEPVKNKRERYAAYAQRGAEALAAYVKNLSAIGLERV